MPPPPRTPDGLQLARMGLAVRRAFDQALAEAGGSLPLWVVLWSLQAEPKRTQLELARAIGIEGPTLTRHLDRFEAAGYVERERDRVDRRAIRVELTPAGERMLRTLLDAAIAFNRRLTAGVNEQELKRLQVTLDRLEANLRP